MLFNRLYRGDNGTVTETGATAVVLEYRYGSSIENVWSRSIVWVLERSDGLLIAEVGWPEFPGGGGDDPRGQPLIGLDPLDLLADVRLFEER